MFVVTVDWTIKPESIALFKEKITAQAADSVKEEAECFRFDVCEAIDGAGQFLLYEVYASKAAFKVHLEMPYSKEFLPLADAMTISKDVKTYALISANEKITA